VVLELREKGTGTINDAKMAENVPARFSNLLQNEIKRPLLGGHGFT
jgi:hypothetical protein